MWLQINTVLLGVGIVTFLLGLSYLIRYYISSGPSTLEECQKQHRRQAWTTFSFGLVLLAIYGIMKYWAGRNTTTYY